MTSSSSLYGSTPSSQGNVSSSNLTTLYSGNAVTVPSNGNLVIPGTLTVNGCAILTDCGSFSLLPTTATTILFGNAATTMSIGSSSGVTTINNQLATANYTFPLADGVNGQVIVTDGAGTLSFAAVTTVGKTYNIDATTTTGGANFNLNSDIPTVDTIKFANGTNMSVVRTDANTITFNATDTNTTYNIDASSTTGGANLNLNGSDSTVDPVKFASGSGITVAQTDANTITITNSNPGGTGVTSITGTANQVIASASTGAVTLSTPQDIATTSNVNFGSVTTSGDIAVNGGDITTTQTTASLYNTTATTVNIAGAGSAVNIGNQSSSSAYVSVPVLRLYGNLSQIDGGTVITTSTATFPIVSTTRQSMKVILNIVDNVTTEVHSVEAFLMKKGTNAYLTTYAEMYSASALATFSADVSGGSVRLLVTPLSANNTTSRVIKQSLT